MHYTAEMEKAMEQSHKMCFAEYSRKLSNRLKVEKQREKDYTKCKQLIADVESHVLR